MGLRPQKNDQPRLDSHASNIWLPGMVGRLSWTNTCNFVDTCPSPSFPSPQMAFRRDRNAAGSGDFILILEGFSLFSDTWGIVYRSSTWQYRHWRLTAISNVLLKSNTEAVEDIQSFIHQSMTILDRNQVDISLQLNEIAECIDNIPALMMELLDIKHKIDFVKASVSNLAVSKWSDVDCRLPELWLDGNYRRWRIFKVHSLDTNTGVPR